MKRNATVTVDCRITITMSEECEYFTISYGIEYDGLRESMDVKQNM